MTFYDFDKHTTFDISDKFVFASLPPQSKWQLSVKSEPHANSFVHKLILKSHTADQEIWSS